MSKTKTQRRRAPRTPKPPKRETATKSPRVRSTVSHLVRDARGDRYQMLANTPGTLVSVDNAIGVGFGLESGWLYVKFVALLAHGKKATVILDPPAVMVPSTSVKGADAWWRE